VTALPDRFCERDGLHVQIFHDLTVFPGEDKYIYIYIYIYKNYFA
jgi:hypothetical protein